MYGFSRTASSNRSISDFSINGKLNPSTRQLVVFSDTLAELGEFDGLVGNAFFSVSRSRCNVSILGRTGSFPSSSNSPDTF